MTKTQKTLIDRMRAGRRLWWFGDNGPELERYPLWPQKRTVRALLAADALRWKPWDNPTQRQAGICELEVVEHNGKIPRDQLVEISELDGRQVDPLPEDGRGE